MTAALAASKPPPPPFTHRWVLRAVLPQRYGQLCRIVFRPLARGYYAAMANPAQKVLIEFGDGTQVEAARCSIRSLRRPGFLQGGNQNDGVRYGSDEPPRRGPRGR